VLTYWGEISSFTTFLVVWLVGWVGKIEIKANSAQLELELGLSLAKKEKVLTFHKVKL
jgi:hypothetical protein